MNKLFTIFFSFLVYLTVFSEVDLNSILLNKKVSSNSNNLKFIQASNITNLDPAEIEDLDSIRFFKYLYDTLFYFDNDEELKSNLIKTWSWKTEKTLYIKIKDNLFFADGSPLTTHDIKNSFNRILEKDTLDYLFNSIKDISIINDKELLFVLDEVNPIFLKLLTYQVTSIVKVKDTKLIGTGPYKIFSSNKIKLVLKKNKNYYNTTNSPASLTFIYEKNTNKRLLAFLNNNVDGALDISSDFIDEKLRKEINTKHHTSNKNYNKRGIFLLFGKNNTIFDDMKNRRLLYNDWTLKNSLTYHINTDRNFNTFLQTKTIKPLKLIVSQNFMSLGFSNSIIRKLKKFGLNIEVIPHNHTSFLNKIRSRNFDLALYSSVIPNKYNNKTYEYLFMENSIDKKNLELLAYKLKLASLSNNNEKFIPILHNFFTTKLPYIPLTTIETTSLINKKAKQNFSSIKE